MGQPSQSVPFLERLEIEMKAAELIRPMTGEFRPLDAFGIAWRLGIPVIHSDFGGTDVAGMLVREGGNAEIQVRMDDRYERQNFTVAHELGHLTLGHPGTWKDTKTTMYRRSAWSADTSERRAEYQANLFAAALLMPEPVFREKWELFRSVHYLPPYFRVSKTAIQRRVEELGLIVPTPKGVYLADFSGWDANLGIPEPPTLFDEEGPIPSFPPIQTDEFGRIVMGDEERKARSAAFSRVLRHAGNRTDDELGAEGGEPEDAEVTPEA